MIANRVVESCDSTNDLARALGEAGYPEGTWVSSRSQNLGRGRQGRQWISPPGQLYLSCLSRSVPAQFTTWVPLASALALAKSVHLLFPQADLRIKWPNDVWLDNRKLAGILCEGVGGKENSFIVIGVGVNCGPMPEGVDQPVTSLLELAPTRPKLADELRPLLVRQLAQVLDRLATPEGVQSVSAQYSRLALFQAGTEVEWTQNSDQHSTQGQVLGLGDSGELRVETVAGKELSLWAEEVKLRLVLK
ncbi:MAG: biotin--[acetyl-CoA-carboxylase] ligase [Methylotenera sp.]|nr:biotin--[acetyl-CoA-carboxylase] ligase [Oligoflexia bacterium]